MNNYNVKIDGDILRMDGNEIEFPNTIGEILEYENLAVLRLKLTGESFQDISQNVYGVTPDGSIYWKIDKCPDITGGGYHAYSGLYNHGGELWVTNYNGMKYKVSKEDGSIMDKKISK